MNITKTAINNKPLFTALVIAAIFMGIAGYNSMSRDDMPPFLIRAVSVVTTFSGASPARVEELVTDKIEKIIQEIPEVD
jgi:multidrug efflux pump subunit AcrB